MAVYRFSYGTRAAGCKGPKPCTGTPIPKGELRFGTQITVKEKQSFVYRHYGCITKKQWSNIKEDFTTADDIDGFEDLTEEDQAKIRSAYEAGEVADEDIPASARKVVEVDSDGEPVKKAKAAPKKRKTAAEKRAEEEADDDDDAEGEPKPKKVTPKKVGKAKAPAKKATKAKKSKKESDSESAAVTESESDAPKKKKAKKSKDESESAEESS